MEPEEIDKLFRDKLAGLPAVPSPDAWARLQQKMEPPKKQRTRWVYYAAASGVLVLLAGLLFFYQGANPTGPAIATVSPEAPALAQAPPVAPSVAPSHQQQEAQAAVATAPETATPAASKRLMTAKAHRAHPASMRATKTPAPALEMAAATKETPEEDESARPVDQTTALPAGTLASTHAAPAFVEVVVKRDAASNVDEENSLRDHLNRKGHLLKNIYKQARNLKNGEPVELATLGVDKSRIQEETKELKQKLTNVISL